jgi:hypothetical protein
VAVFAVAVAVAVAGGRWQWHHRIGRGSAVILSGDKSVAVAGWRGGSGCLLCAAAPIFLITFLLIKFKLKHIFTR